MLSQARILIIFLFLSACLESKFVVPETSSLGLQSPVISEVKNDEIFSGKCVGSNGPVTITGSDLANSYTLTCENKKFSSRIRFDAPDGNKNFVVSQGSESFKYNWILDTVAPVDVLIAEDLDSTPTNTFALQNIRIHGATTDVKKTRHVQTLSADCDNAIFSNVKSKTHRERQVITPVYNRRLRLCAIGSDLAGNWQTAATDLGTITLDTIGPTRLGSITHARSHNSTAQTPVLTWTPTTDNLTGVAKYQVSVGSTAGSTDLMNWTDVGAVLTAQPNVDLTSRSGLMAYAQVRAVDGVGNISAMTYGQGWYVGIPVIDLSIDAPVSMDYINRSNYTTFQVRGYCSEIGRNVSITLGSLGPVTAVCSATHSYSTIINTLTLPEGSVALSVTHDNAIAQTRTISLTLWKDTIAPTVAITSPVNGSSYANYENLTTIKGTCSEIGGNVEITSNIGYSTTLTCSASSTFEFKISLGDLTEPTIYFFATQLDLAGNNSVEASLFLKNGTVISIVPSTLLQANGYGHTTVARPLVFGGDKVMTLIQGTSDAVNQLAISNTDGSQFKILSDLESGSVASFGQETVHPGKFFDYLSGYNLIYYTKSIPNTEAFGIYRVHPDGTGSQLMIGVSGSNSESNFVKLSHSQDESYLFFLADLETDGVFELYRSDIEGGNILKLNGTLASGGTVKEFHILNSGKIIYFAEQDTNDILDLYIVNDDGTGNVKLNPAYDHATATRKIGSYTTNETETHLVFSMDKRVTAKFDLYSVPLDGTYTPILLSTSTVGRNLLALNRFSVSPDGSKVAFSQLEGQGAGDYHIWVATLDGVSNYRITPNVAASRDYTGMEWDPNSLFVYVTGDVGTTDNMSNFANMRSDKAYNAVGGNNYTLLTDYMTAVIYEIAATIEPERTLSNNNRAFKLTSDNQRIVFNCDNRNDAILNYELCSIKIDGTDYKTLAPVAAQSKSVITNFQLSPDGKEVSFLGDLESASKHELYRCDVDAASCNKVSLSPTFGAVVTNFGFTNVDWAKDRFYYRIRSTPSTTTYGYSSTLDGATHDRLGTMFNNSDVSNLGFDGNGRLLYLLDSSSGNDYNLYSQKADGTDRKTLNPTLGANGAVESYILTSDKLNVIYVVTPSSSVGSEIHIRKSDGSTADLNLTPGNQALTNITSYVLTPDEQHLIFLADRVTDGVNEVFSVELDGSNLTRLNAALPGFAAITAYKISPDSDTVAILADYALDAKTEWYISRISAPSMIDITPTSNEALNFLRANNIAVFSSDDRFCYMGTMISNAINATYCIDSDATDFISVTPGAAASKATDTYIMASPDGTQVFLRGDLITDNVFGVFAANVDGSGVTELSGAAANAARKVSAKVPFLSTTTPPKLIFIGDLNVSGVDEVFSVNFDGTDLTQLNETFGVNDDIIETMLFQNKLVYKADVGVLNNRVYSVNVDGTNLTSLTPFVNNYTLVFGSLYSAGNDYLGIVANGTKKAVKDCYVVKVDGTDLKKVTPNLAVNSIGCGGTYIQTINGTEYSLSLVDIDSFGVMNYYVRPLDEN